MKYLLFAILLLVTLACLPSAVTPAAILAIGTPTRTAPPMLPSASPDWRATAQRAEAIVTAEVASIERGRLDLDGTQAAHDMSMQELNAARQHELNRTLTAAEAYAVVSRAQVEASATAAWIAVEVQNANATRTAAAQIVSITQVVIDGNRATQTAAVRLETLTAPYTATVEAQRLEDVLNKAETGTAIIRVIAWASVMLAFLGLMGWEFVVLVGKWNREAVSEQLTLAQGSVMRAGSEVIQHDGTAWAKFGAPAPDNAKPVKPIPIYGVGNPAPQTPPPLNEIERRSLEFLRRSNELYGEVDTRRIASSLETGSGSMWEATLSAWEAAGIELVRTNRGTFLSGVGISRDELIYKIETGEVQL